MGRTLDEIMSTLPSEERTAIESEAHRLIEEEHTLRELRKAFSLTQAQLAETLGVGQDEVSRIERRADMLVSTLRRFVEAMGGELDLVARFPDHPSVNIVHLGDLVSGSTTTGEC